MIKNNPPKKCDRKKCDKKIYYDYYSWIIGKGGVTLKSYCSRECLLMCNPDCFGGK